MSADISDTSQNFFNQLRRVARNVEHSVTDLQKLSEHPNESTGHMGVIKKLTDMKKNVKELKVDARNTTEKLQRNGNSSEEILQLCHSLIDIQKKKLMDIGIFLQQYGYKCKPETTEDSATMNEESKIEEAVEQKPVGTPEKKTENKTCRTPKLEDFGLSQMTLSILAKTDKFAEPVRCAPSNQLKNQRKVDRFDAESSGIPGIFEHNGLFMTPSVLGKKFSFQTPDHISQYNSPVWTPMEEVSSKPNTDKFNHELGAKLSLFGKGVDIQESPAPLKLQAQGVSTTNEKHPVNFPKMKINKVVHDVDDDDSVPQPPELTISLSALSELTGVYNTSIREPPKPASTISEASRYGDLSKEPKAPALVYTGATSFSSIKEPPKPKSIFTETSRYLDEEPQAPELTINYKSLTNETCSPMPKGFKSLAKQLDCRDENKTPPMPEMLSERLKLETSETDTPKPLYGYGSSALPQPPKLLGKYNFMDLQENIPP